MCLVTHDTFWCSTASFCHLVVVGYYKSCYVQVLLTLFGILRQLFCSGGDGSLCYRFGVKLFRKSFLRHCNKFCKFFVMSGQVQ